MTPNEYQKEALRTASGMSKEYPRILNGLMGLNGEAGECIDILKKHLYQGHAFDSEHMAKELGDVAWYLAISAEAIGYDLETIFQMNIDKLRARYPDGFDAEKVLRHKEICDGLNELYARKNHDYGDSFHTTFVEEGLAMARIRLGDKFSRFKTLSRLSCNNRDQQQVTDESIRDTLLDLANYAIMTVLEMDTPDESHATLYAYDKPIYTVKEDK